MKASRIVLFICAVFLLLGAVWWVYPAEGVTVGDTTLRFPSYAEDRLGPDKVLDVDSVLDQVSRSFEMNVSRTQLDSLEFYRDYLTVNPNRIHLPDNDYTYFDSLFFYLEHAREHRKIYRVMHYGDSQIEMDRITSVLRQRLQELFGGSGPNMIPAIQRVATVSVSQSYSGNLIRYSLVTDSTTRRASHNRYGVMAQFSQTSGSSTVSFVKTYHSQAFEKAKEISTVSVLMGNNSEGFKATLRSGTELFETKEFPAKSGITLMTWRLPNNIDRGTLTFQGNAEIYAILLDGDYGVAVDNDALRGCAGTIFTRINPELMDQSFKAIDTKMIILQFGGNRMPSITNTRQISSYIAELDRQVKYFKQVAPQATFLFIGPADMGKSYNGHITTWHGLPELNDSLQAMALRNGMAYWDLFHVMGGEGSMAQYVRHRPQLAGPDHIHFTSLGAREIGNDLARAFIVYHDFYRLRQGLSDDASLREFMNMDRELIEQERAARRNRFKPTEYY